MSNLKYCANGEEGIEAVFDTKQECDVWIRETVAENDMPSDYYNVEMFTQKELNAMPEV